ncbi:hypothetical protein PVK06_005189 [Gossypium arboreum]|uniref:DUF7745 domain-containing protein n=1 Tax=Gossypium arboreum TaxID=29729 RepID=A0ABR0QU57_GOSAR|nr:hypothetical protein PVK06_005189 [Gossypium arboreum]
MSGPIPFRKSNLRLSYGNMSPYKFKDYSMVKMDIDVRVVNATMYTMKVLTPKITRMNCRRNRKDELKGICQSWDKAKKMHFRDKYGNVAQLLFFKPNDALLKAMVRFWDPTYRCFTFNEVIPTIDEYSTLFYYDFKDLLRIYWKQNVDFLGPLTNLMDTCRYGESKIKR